MKKQVDVLFKRVWHYFDQVAIVGPSPTRILVDFAHDEQTAIYRIVEYVDLLLYLRESGADDLMVFIDKPVPNDENDLESYLADLGLSEVANTAHQLVEQIASEYSVTTEVDEGRKYLRLSHPWWDSSQMFDVARAHELGDDLLHVAASNVVQMNLYMGVSDLASAKMHRLPLATSAALQDELIHRAPNSDTDAASVAFDLDLPYLGGISTRELLRLRDDERSSFEQFRSSIRDAVRERVAAGEVDDPAGLAQEILEDVVQPDIAKINNRLISAQRSWSRKTGTQVLIGSVATTVGLLVAAPVAIGAGIATMIASAVVPGLKYFDDRQQIELEDMYFLWRLSDRDRDHAS